MEDRFPRYFRTFRRKFKMSSNIKIDIVQTKEAQNNRAHEGLELLGDFRVNVPVVPGLNDQSQHDCQDISFDFDGFEFLVTYPLSKPAIVTARCEDQNKFCVDDIISSVRSAYQEIYRIEDLMDSSEIEAQLSGARKERALQNRMATNGQFGIWGHDIYDLWIERIQIAKRKSGEIPVISISIGS